MSNEEKILELLEKHGEMLKRLQEDQSEIRETLTRVAITQELGIQDGQTTEDGMFTLNEVACLGCCSRGTGWRLWRMMLPS